MKKTIKIFSLVIISCLLFSGCGKQKFSLDDKYYGSGQINEISDSEFQNLIDNEETFAMFIYQPLCAASDALEKVLNEFVYKNQLTFYKMSFTNMKKTALGEEIKYYPSVVIYHEGQIVDYLDANSEEDEEIYQNIDEFTNWFAGYVKFDEDLRMDAKLEDIKYDENKVNIYFFWGNGCPHCEEEHEFFDKIKKEYGKYYKLNTFEIWYNEDNLEILKQFAERMKADFGGIPYTIIGNEIISGFDERAEKKIIDAIMSQYKNSYDVYFDIKENEVQE